MKKKMIKNKIAFKLTMYFSICLILFSIIIGSVFTTLFKDHTIKIYKEDLKNRAITIAYNLSEVMSSADNTTGMMGGRHGGYGAYLHLLNDIAMTDIWIVDENLEFIMSGKMSNLKFKYADLPQDAETVVKDVFLGNTAFSEGFSNIIKTPTLTVGTPIKSNGKIIGALLLHSPIKGMKDAINQGLNLLIISVLIALILSMFLSVIMALVFTKPLKSMKSTAFSLANGNYTVKTNVKQNDEIGELADAIIK